MVTANYHMPRSLVELSRAMPRTTLVAHPVVTRGFHADGWWRYARSARLLVSEYLKLLPSIARYAFGKVTGETLSGVAAATRERTPASFVAKQ